MSDNRLMRLPIAIILITVSWTPVWTNNLILKNTPAKVFFSPNGGCQDAVINAIASARKSILVQAYSFTSAPIAEALKKAHNSGINVSIILDRSQETGRYSGLTYLQNAGIPVWIDHRHAIAHNKVMIIDNETVITGSFNFTKAAEKNNSENIIIINNTQLAQLYINNWQTHRQHSELPKSGFLRLIR